MYFRKKLELSSRLHSLWLDLDDAKRCVKRKFNYVGGSGINWAGIRLTSELEQKIVLFERLLN